MPSLSEMASNFAAVSIWVAIILTPATTAFWESLTRPLMVARNSCAEREWADNKASKTGRDRPNCFFCNMRDSLSYDLQRDPLIRG